MLQDALDCLVDTVAEAPALRLEIDEFERREGKGWERSRDYSSRISTSVLSSVSR